MGDRSSWNYSRSYGSGSGDRSRYTSSSGNISYTRSADYENHRGGHGGHDSSYTRSSSSRYNRDRDYRGKEDFDRSHYNRGVSRDSYYHHSSRGTGDGSAHWQPYSRDSDLRQNHGHDSRPHYNAPQSQDRSQTESSHWSSQGRKRSDSPSTYVNRSPPRRSFNSSSHAHDRKQKSPSPPRSHGLVSRLNDEPKGSVGLQYTPWNKPDFNNFRNDRRQSDDVFHSKYGSQGVEIDKLTSRLKEYVPWLTSRKASIFDYRRDKELKEEVDDIDWCLDVIQDIKSNENVGMQTIKRAQNMVMALISKGPVTSTTVTILVTEEPKPSDGICRDDIYSARSPSPPSIQDGVQFTRRSDNLDVNPRVIPTDRDVFPTLTSTIFPPTCFQEKFISQQVEPAAMSPVNALVTQFAANTRVDSGHKLFISNQTVPFLSKTLIEAQDKPPTLDEKIYDYDHGQHDQKTLDEDLFERRQPQSQSNFIKKKDNLNRESEAETLARIAAEDRRRLKDWEEGSDEEEAVINRRWTNDLKDEDLRFYNSDSTSKGSRPERFTEGIQSPEPMDKVSHSYDTSTDKINSNASTLPRPSAPLSPTKPTVPQQSFAALPQGQPSLPLHLMNNPLFNPFLNQLLMRFPSMATPAGAGLLPLPNANIQNPNLGMKYPGQNLNSGLHQPTAAEAAAAKEALDKQKQAEEEIMMARIKARAAESFSNRGNNSRPGFSSSTTQGTGYGNSSASQTSGVPSQPQSNQAQPSMGPPTRVLDPRLKPRQPRDFPKEPRIANARNEQPEPVPDPEPAIPESHTPKEPIVPVPAVVSEATDHYSEHSDSDTDLRIDLSARLSENESSDREGSPTRKASSVSALVDNSNSLPSSSTQSSPEVAAKPTLPAVADELIKTLLFKSLSDEEAAVLNSSEDYLASTLARLKEELSAKVKERERTRQLSGDHMESFVSSTTLPGATTTDFKDEDAEHSDDNSRSRRVTRSSSKKAPAKRRSSLERLHDALREMNFDSMLPLGRRRNLTKLSNEQEQTTDSVDQEKSPETTANVPVPKLSPAVILNSCKSKDTTLSPNKTVVESPEMPVTTTRQKRKYTRKKGRARRNASEMEIVSTQDEDSGRESPSPAKKSKSEVDNEEIVVEPGDIAVNAAIEINVESNSVVTETKKDDDVKTAAKDQNVENAPNAEVADVKDYDLDLMDLAKDLATNPTDFGLPEDDNLMYKPEDFHITLSDEDLPSFKAEDLDLCADDFVIDDVGLQIHDVELKISTIQSNDAKDASKQSSVETNNSTSAAVAQGIAAQRRGRKKKSRGITEEFPCPMENCQFLGTLRRTVDHYVNDHPGVTIPQACLTERANKRLEEVNKSESPQLMEVEFGPRDVIRCIFCNIILSSIVMYCQHLTGHTGEFRFKCSKCNLKFFTKQLALAHCRAHKKDNIELDECYVETKLAIEEGENEFYGYICRECNYFQINSEGIREHLDLTKHCETDVACIKFKGMAKVKKPKEIGAVVSEANIKFGRRRSSPSKDPPVLKEEKPIILQPPPPSPPEVPKSVFLLPESTHIPELPTIVSAGASRYACAKRPRIQRLLTRYALEDEVSPTDNSENDSAMGRFETEEQIESASLTTLQWLVDTVSCELEMEEDIQNLADVIRDSEEAFCGVPIDLDGSLSLRSISDESPSVDSSSMSEDGEDEEPNDYYLDEVTDSDSDGETVANQGNATVEVDAADQSVSSSVLTDHVHHGGESITSPRSVTCKLPTSSPGALYISSPPTNPPSVLQQGQDEADMIIDLEGSDLYRCGNLGCGFSSPNVQLFKIHNPACRSLEPGRGYACAHCPRRLKTLPAFYEHINGHGKAHLWCAICSFKGRNASEMKRHFKVQHKCYGWKGESCKLPPSCDSIWFPKEIYDKRIELQLIQKNPLLYVPQIQFLPNEIDDIPKSCILLSEVHCALCAYSTKVRVNMIRHLNLHKRAEENDSTNVPVDAPVNPVPWIERKELMFDKMTNWAGSTHNKKSELAASVKGKFPTFVAEQFRYVCSVTSCGQITVDDSMLKAHMRALHSEFDHYQCPHCQLAETTKFNSQYTVPIEKLGTHLKLHGPKLLKCGHCDFMSIYTKFMEKHVLEKHSELKPSHFVIRNLDENGKEIPGKSKIGPTEEGSSSKTNLARWRCESCKVALPSWERAKSHIQSVHNSNSQFMCDSCQFHTDSMFQLAKHITSKTCVRATQSPPKAMVYFSQSELAEENIRYPIWRRVNSREHLRGIYYLHENELRSESDPAPTPSKAPSSGKALATSSSKVLTGPPPAKVPATLSSAKSSAKAKLPLARRKQALPPVNKDPAAYICCQCATYKTRTAEAMKTHLRQHLNYHRYTCKICGNRSWTMSSFKLHVEADHGEPFNPNRHLQTEPRNPTIENKLEVWMSLCMQDPLAPSADEVIFLPSPEPAPISPVENNSFCEEIFILD